MDINDKDKKAPKLKKRYIFAGAKKAEAVTFVVVMLIGTIFSFDLGARPTVSEKENRNLAVFPAFSVKTLLSGDYFDDIGLWFSDTFPYRDGLIELNSKLKRLMGLRGGIYNFDEGSGGDDIPDTPMTTAAPVADESSSDEGDSSSGAVSTKAETTTSSAQTTRKGDDTDTQALSSIFIAGNAGYEYYNFVQSTADRYISAVNYCADRIKSQTGGACTVYDMVIPTSIDITLDSSVRSSINSSNQRKAISYMLNSMNGSVKPVDVFDILKSHNDEYIYFRTDHHWTALGAYYGYSRFCEVSGNTAPDLSTYTEKSSEGFLGSFYKDSDNNAKLAATPDTLVSYSPAVNTRMTVTNMDGSTYNWPMIANADTYSSSLKYSCFAGADNPYSVIENLDRTDDKSCLVVKESFGNVFSPYLISNYKYVYLIDYRYWQGSIPDFVSQNGVDDVIFCNNVSMTRNANLVGKLELRCAQ